MAKLSVSVDVPLPPEAAWACASDLSRYKEWLTIHRVWRTKAPEKMEKGTVVESIVEVKVKLIGKVKPSGAGSTVTFDVHLGGPALFGPIGMVVAGALKGDIRDSLNRFKSVFAAA